ncbi:MAG: hypothetical protein ACM3OC_03430 [Deltaproteobacteria bacterium]
MKWFSVAIILLLVVAVGFMFFSLIGKSAKEHQYSVYLDKLASQVVELEGKINDLVAYQIKNSENNRQVYGAVARLCTIFEGILQINSGKPPVVTGLQQGGQEKTVP